MTRTSINNVDYHVATHTVEDATFFAVVATITAPTAAQLNGYAAAPLVLLPESLVSKSSRGVARRVFLQRAWIRSGATPPAATTAAFVMQDTSTAPVATAAQTSAVFTASTGLELLNPATGVTLAAGAYAGLVDAKGLQLVSTGTFTGGPYSDIQVGLYGVILPTSGSTRSLGTGVSAYGLGV